MWVVVVIRCSNGGAEKPNPKSEMGRREGKGECPSIRYHYNIDPVRVLSPSRVGGLPARLRIDFDLLLTVECEN